MGERSPSETPAADPIARLEGFVAQVSGARDLLSYSREVGDLLQQALELVRRSQAQLAEALDTADRARQELAEVLESLPTAVLVVDGGGRVERANRAAVETVGCAPLEGRPASAFVGEVPVEGTGEIRLGGNGAGERRLLVRRSAIGGSSGRELVVLEARASAAVRPVDAEFAAAAARMAHKINNPLTSLIGRAQLLRFVSGSEPQVERAATTIEESARRVAELVREFAAAVQAADPSRIERAITADAQAAAARAAGSS